MVVRGPNLPTVQAPDLLRLDEPVEATPQSIRLRKRLLTAGERARARKDARVTSGVS